MNELVASIVLLVGHQHLNEVLYPIAERAQDMIQRGFHRDDIQTLLETHIPVFAWEVEQEGNHVWKMIGG